MLLSPIGSPNKTLAQLSFPLEPPEVELRLPIELILYIAELALRSTKRCGLSLCLVSSWMRESALPFMYSTVLLHGSTSFPFLLPLYNGARRLSSPVRYIHHLWIDVPHRESWPHSLCDSPHLVQLAMHLECHEFICQSDIWRYEDPDCSPCRSFTVLGQSHPMRWTPFTQSSRGIAFLKGLTHLRLLNMCLSHYVPLEHTPNLTHLCVPFFDLRCNEGSEFSGLDPILQHPNLKMIVLTLNPRYWRFEEMSLKRWAKLAMEKDRRLYVVASIRVDATKDWEDARKAWESEAKGGESIWDKAVKIRDKFMSRSWDGSDGGG